MTEVQVYDSEAIECLLARVLPDNYTGTEEVRKITKIDASNHQCVGNEMPESTIETRSYQSKDGKGIGVYSSSYQCTEGDRGRDITSSSLQGDGKEKSESDVCSQQCVGIEFPGSTIDSGRKLRMMEKGVEFAVNSVLESRFQDPPLTAEVN